MAVDLLLHPPPHVIDHLRGEPDDVEGVQDRAGVFELVVDRVLVPVERVQRRDLDPGPERLAPVDQPGLVGVAGAAGDQVEQPRADHEFACAVGVHREVHHPGQLLRSPAAVLDRLGGHVVPVGSARGAVPGLLGVRFPGPPAEPGVRFSPHRALHEWLLFSQWWLSVSMGSGSGSRGSGTG